MKMNRRVLPLCFITVSVCATSAYSQSFLSQYKGSPFHDSHYQGSAQKVPGQVLCAYYALGGEGVAYHDTDAKNHGSGELNPADGSYLNEFVSTTERILPIRNLTASPIRLTTAGTAHRRARNRSLIRCEARRLDRHARRAAPE